jgi:hypothetical protein
MLSGEAATILSKGTYEWHVFVEECLIYIICICLCIVYLFVYSCVTQIVLLFGLFIVFLCTLWCQFLWVVHFWLPLLYSLTFIYKIISIFFIFKCETSFVSLSIKFSKYKKIQIVQVRYIIIETKEFARIDISNTGPFFCFNSTVSYAYIS